MMPDDPRYFDDDHGDDGANGGDGKCVRTPYYICKLLSKTFLFFDLRPDCFSTCLMFLCINLCFIVRSILTLAHPFVDVATLILIYFNDF